MQLLNVMSQWAWYATTTIYLAWYKSVSSLILLLYYIIVILLRLHQFFQLKMERMERLHTLFTNRPHFRVVEKWGTFESVFYLPKMQTEHSNHCLIDEMSWDVVSATCSTCLNSQTIAAASCKLFMSIQCLLVKCDCSTFHASGIRKKMIPGAGLLRLWCFQASDGDDSPGSF